MESNNKKIKGATSIEYNGIKFKSILECSCYKKLEAAGFDFFYESERITLWDGVKLQNTLVYAPKKIRAGKYGKFLELQTRALLSTTYTPDVVVTQGNYKSILMSRVKRMILILSRRKCSSKHLRKEMMG